MLLCFSIGSTPFIGRCCGVDCLQGSVISPTLFNIYMRRLTHGLPVEVKLENFAGDSTFYFEFLDLTKSKALLLSSFEIVKYWLDSRNMEISTKKF